MKDDREFMNGIYEKAQKLLAEENEQRMNGEEVNAIMRGHGLRIHIADLLQLSKRRKSLTIAVMATVACIIVVPYMLVTQSNDREDSKPDDGITLSSYDDENQRALPVATMNSSGIIMDQYSKNGEDFLLVEQEGMSIVLYNNGLFNEVLDNVKNGMKVEFSYVDTEVTTSEELKEKIRAKFANEVSDLAQLQIYPIDSIQIKE